MLLGTSVLLSVLITEVVGYLEGEQYNKKTVGIWSEKFLTSNFKMRVENEAKYDFKSNNIYEEVNWKLIWIFKLPKDFK